GVLAVMAQDHHVAVPALLAGVLDHAVAHGAHARAGRRAVVDAGVLAPGLRDRMTTHAEARGHSRKLERRAQKRLAQVVAVGRVVAVAELHGAERPAVVGELRGEYPAGAHRAAV